MATIISPMHKFQFGSKITCTDSEYGVLAHIICDPATQHMTHIGVKQRRFLGKTVTVDLPFATITHATSDEVLLNLKSADVATANSIAVEGIQLSSKSIVELTSTASKGSLLLVATHPQDGALAYLVAHHLLPGQDTLLQNTTITTLAPEHITITVADTALDTLPLYRPDRTLQQAIEAIIFDLTLLHVDLKGIIVSVIDSILYLNGNISSTLRADIVMDQVQGTPGLLEIKNNLIGDDRLAGDLALALGRDPRTRDLPIGVYPRLGTVRLSGAVHTSQQKIAAEEIARSFLGVRSIINELSIDPKADLLHIMSATGGNQDKVPNKYTRHTQ